MPNTIIEFSQNILKFNKEKKYEISLKYFKENKSLFNSHEISNNEYLVSGIITALRHTIQFESAFKFLDLYGIKISGSTSEMVLNSYGWLLYFKFKSENFPDDSTPSESEEFDVEEEYSEIVNHNYTKIDILQRIEFVMPLIININSNFSYTLFSNLFNIVLKAEKKKGTTNWLFVNNFCDLINPEKLLTVSKTIDIIRKGQEKKMELSSDKETWFAFKSKALMKLGRFQDCYDVSKIALTTFQIFHYSNDIWFARRIALSMRSLGNPEEAIVELESILKKKKEWFIQKELAELYKEKGNTEKAFELAISAINSFGDLEYKIDLLIILGELLLAKEDSEKAYKHFSLSKLIREKENWNIPLKLKIVLEEFKRESISINEIDSLKKELSAFWNTFKHKNYLDKNINSTFIGRIEKILHNDEKGADGFIKYNKNNTIYFRISSEEELRKKLFVGINVEFKIVIGQKDNREKAINLKIKDIINS